MINLPPAKSQSSDPAITINRYGQGRAMFIACPLVANELKGHKSRWDDAREFPMQLAENLARFMLDTPLLAGNTPPGVEVVINAKDNLHIVHLLNNHMTGQYIDNRRGLLKLANVPLTINEQWIGKVKKAFLFDYTANQKIELSLRRNGPWLEVRIPEMSAYEIIILEH